MPYLEDYSHDVFVSYAHSGLLTSWSKELCGELINHMNELLELKNRRSVDIWMDYQLEGNVGLTPQLEKHVKGSALLLILMSNFYLDSPWCGDEARWFASQCKDRSAGDGRIFVVRCRPTDESRWPMFLKDERGSALPGYQFFPNDRRPDIVPLPFGHPKPQDAVDESRREFFRAVTGLAEQMQSRMRQLSKTKPPPIAQRPRTTRMALLEPRAEQQSATNILLAASTEDVAPEQEALRAGLGKAGFRVVPEADQSDLSLLSQLFPSLGPNCTAATMVLGGLPGRQPLIDGQPFVRWQHEQIVRFSLPHVIWLPPSVDPQKIRDADYQNFVGGLQAVRHDSADAVAAAVAGLVPGSGGQKRFIFLDAPQISKAGELPETIAANPMEQDLRSILKCLNARVFPLSRGRPTAIGLSEIEEYRRQLRTLKAKCDVVLLLLQNPELVPDLWLLEFERDIASASQEPKAGGQPPRCAVIDATGTYEPSEGLQVFHYPNPALQDELHKWLN